MLTEDNHFMLDLETLSLSAHALVLTVGGCIFNRDGIKQSWHWHLDTSKQPRRRIDVSTVRWWMQQSEEARAAAFDLDGVELLHHFAVRDKLVEIRDHFDVKKWWAHSPAFDGVILNTLLSEELCGHRDWLDTRTFAWVTGIEMPRARKGTLHNAEDDARHQAQYLIDTCRNWRS